MPTKNNSPTSVEEMTFPNADTGNFLLTSSGLNEVKLGG